MATTTEAKQVPLELPGATQYRAWEGAARRRQTLRANLKETLEEQTRARREAEQLQTVALETEGRLLLGDASRGELDKALSAAEAAASRAGDLEAWGAKLKQQLATVEKELPELRKHGEHARAEMIKVARQMHERAVEVIAEGIKGILEGNKEQRRTMEALVSIIGEEATRYLQPLGFLVNEQIEQSAEHWFREAKTHDYKV